MRSVFLAALLIPAVLSTACQSVQQSSSRNVSPADRALEDAVSERLDLAMPNEVMSIGVRADGGVVTLFGTVQDAAIRMQAENIAANTPGVTRVEVRITP
jgi:osmotically-inducible protein OsmY